MKPHQLLISMSLLASPLATRIISGAGRMLGERAFPESAMVIYWISRNPTQLREAKELFVKEIDRVKKELPEEIK